MARRVSGPSTAKPEVYTFKECGNRLAPAADQVRVTHRWPTQADVRRSASRALQRQDIVNGEAGPGMMALQLQELSRLCTLDVQNYEGPDGPIVDGDDFATYGETEFVTELGLRLMGDTALTPDWCKVCGEDLEQGQKACRNPACPSVKGQVAREVGEGEGVPSGDSCDSKSLESPSDGPSVPEGQKSAQETAAGKDGDT